MEVLESNAPIVESKAPQLEHQGRGGYREGAGRPPGVIETRPRMRIPPDVKKGLAAEYKAQVVKSPDGAARVMRAWWKAIDAGDPKIIKDTLDRVMGRPVTAIELSGPGGGPLRIQAASLVALSLAPPEQLAALEAFSRLVVPPGDDSDEVAGELGEGEPVEAPDDGQQDIISRPVESEPPQVVENTGPDELGTDIADWLAGKD